MQQLPASRYQLDELEYPKLEKLKSRLTTIYRLFFWPYFLLVVTALGLLLYQLYQYLGNDYVACFGVVAFYAFIALISSTLEGELFAEWFDRTFNFVFRRTKLAGEIHRLTEKFASIEKRVESEAIEILAQIKSEAAKRVAENRSISQELRFKRKWRDEYSPLVKTYKQNQALNELIAETVGENLKFIKHDKSKLAEYSRLFRELESKYGEWWVGQKIAQLKAWEPPIVRNSTRNDTTEKVAKSPTLQQVERVRQEDTEVGNSNPIPDTRTPTRPDRLEQIKYTELPPSGRNKQGAEPPTPSGQPSLFDSSLNREVLLPKAERTRQPHVGFEPVKISPELRQRIQARKIQIGEAGELAVMSFERLRLKTSRRQTISEIRHASLTDDSLGYDIQSWDDGQEIYIEVKPTVGSFWSNLYFTEN
ncbi:MAG TPA: DUF3883 domain-containing protein, partial [Pyrinomonadaceae bacterium]|nr:DUF3883 domain-containing protein [Pyrinomonadaceae bacterium]